MLSDTSQSRIHSNVCVILQRRARHRRRRADQKFKYCSSIISIFYRSTRTIRNTANEAGILSQYFSNPIMFLFRASLRLITYIYHIRTHGLKFDGTNKSSGLICSSDSDHASYQFDCKSRSGFAALMGVAAVAWHIRNENMHDALHFRGWICVNMWQKQRNRVNTFLLSHLAYRVDAPTLIGI